MPDVEDPGALPNLADQALSNLVNQFARPLDFLRELAQNAIDAGSPRIEVSVGFDPPGTDASTGVVRIAVDDFGEGMDQDIIDNQLTRLFSSSKEDDRTKIGKFGIGFTSIFAIEPDAVLLRTGRHGEHWELLFHADRSFNKVPLDEPVHGTTVTLFKRMAPSAVAALVQEVRFVLGAWCEHARVPIFFRDDTAQSGPAPAPSDDPFAAFATVRGGDATRVNRPLTLDADLEVHHSEDDLRVVIGTADPPRFGFYNGGLTLLHTQSVDSLGRFGDQLGHLSFKVMHDGLEHTLTRDNVIQDAHWEAAMAGVLRARAPLRDEMMARTVTAAAGGEDLSVWHERLAAEARTPDGADFLTRIAAQPILRDHRGQPTTLARVRAQERRAGFVLLGQGNTALHEALHRNGMLLVEDARATRALLRRGAAPFSWPWSRRTRWLAPAHEVFILPGLVDSGALLPLERQLVARAEDLLRTTVGRRLGVRIGDFAGAASGASVPLALNGPPDGSVFLRARPRWPGLPAFLRWRTLLVNRRHPLFRSQLLAAAEDLDVAAFGLASALLTTEGIEGDGAFRRLVAAMQPEPTP